ncbi:MAG: FAD-dependent oxidoreductase [Dehalococcoidia bacterium]|nr:MAG: FAD-dependent oxidoreductase [Dehalococcoidia bacterium]
MNGPKIIVVGGGIAGLTAAYDLQKRGFDVVVLERNDEAGGRMRSELHGDFVVDRGAQFIASSYRNMRALVDELGLSSRVRRLRTGRGAVLRNGKFVVSDHAGLKAILTARDLGWPSKLRLPRLLLDLRRARKMLDFYHIERAAPIDDASAADWVLRRFGREVLDYLIEPPFASTFTVLPENLSRAFVLATIQYMFSGFRLHAFEGGNGLLTRTLASRLRVRTGADVARIAQSASGATVTLIGGDELAADAVVVATPGNHVERLCATLTPEERDFFEGVRYASSIIVFVMTSTAEADPGIYGLGIGRREGVRLYGLALENPKEGAVPPGKTMFNCAFSEEYAAELMHRTDADVVEALHGELRKLPLRGLDRTEAHAVHRWPELVPQFYPGYIRSLAAFQGRRERSDRLFFAGDYLVGPYTEAALTSGLRAAADVRRRFETGARASIGEAVS